MCSYCQQTARVKARTCNVGRSSPRLQWHADDRVDHLGPAVLRARQPGCGRYGQPGLSLRPRLADRSQKISIRSVTSVRMVNTKRSAKQFARGHRGGIFTTSIPASAMTASQRGRELTGPIAGEEPKPGGTLAEVHHEVASLPRGPRPVGMPRHAQHMQVAVADLEHEQDVEAP